MIPEQSAATLDAMEIDAIKEPVTKKHAVGQVFNKHPPCRSCGKPWKWGKMESWKVWNIYEDDETQTFTWNYRCKDCIKEQEGCETDAAAWAILHERNGLSNWKIQQTAKFSHTRKNIQETFSAFGVKRQGARYTK